MASISASALFPHLLHLHSRSFQKLPPLVSPLSAVLEALPEQQSWSQQMLAVAVAAAAEGFETSSTSTAAAEEEVEVQVVERRC